jgi:outer membrane usher protein
MDPLKPRPGCVRRTRAGTAALAFLAACFACSNGAQSSEPIALQLEVSINGQPANLIAAFSLLPDGRMQTTAGELHELGLKTLQGQSAETPVVLNDITSLSFTYNAATQTIDIVTGDQNRIAKSFDAATGDSQGEIANSFGMVVNYSAFAAAASRKESKKYKVFVFDGASVSLDHRIYSPVGTLSNTGIVGTTAYSDKKWLRLDSNYSASSPHLMLTGTLGDLISGGLPWTRPIRMAGVQLRRNFALRPDLITMPLPQVQGSAAVPSTVDVFVNNVKAYSQDVPAGPFVISNIPVVSGTGIARVVVNEVSGRQSESSLPFYADSDLLAPGLLDFSAEAGVARRGYGIESFAYDGDIVGSASLRYGLTDWLTLEAHGEGGSGLINGGLGAVASLASRATVSVAGSYSTYDNEAGGQIFGAIDTKIADVNLSANSLRSFDHYSDLGFVTADTLPETLDQRITALDRISAGIGLADDWGSVGVSALHLEDAGGKDSYILSASYGRSLFDRVNLQLSAFAELGDNNAKGVFANISMPLGDWGTSSIGGSMDSNGWSAHADAAKPLGTTPGSYGWRVQATEGAVSNAQASVAYLHDYAYAEAHVAQYGDSIQTAINVDGAIAVADGGVFASRRIDDAFAIVDAGVPDVDVYYENRLHGRTGKSGKLLVPGLRAYQKNKIAIEADDLPVNANVLQTSKEIAPARRNGVVVKFDVEKAGAAAIVVFTDASGAFIAPGTEGRMEGSNVSFVVGYDGQAYIDKLGTENQAVLLLQQGECTAHFSYRKDGDAQGFIDHVTCQ